MKNNIYPTFTILNNKRGWVNAGRHNLIRDAAGGGFLHIVMTILKGGHNE